MAALRLTKDACGTFNGGLACGHSSGCSAHSPCARVQYTSEESKTVFVSPFLLPNTVPDSKERQTLKGIVVA